MMRKVSIPVLVAALLMSGALVGVSFGAEEAAITQPEVIELEFSLCENPGVCRAWRQRDFDGRNAGQISTFKVPLVDPDGNEVGRMRVACVGPSVGEGGAVPAVCTYVHRLPGGLVMTIGDQPFGDHRYAVTGGTGAYENVRGYAQLGGPDGFYVLYLTP
jgi:hypothetical protein